MALNITDEPSCSMSCVGHVSISFYPTRRVTASLAAIQPSAYTAIWR